MLSRVWVVTTPLDSELAGDGDDELRALKSELKEHLEQDHQMEGVLDPLQGNCDGYHKKVTFYPLELDPTPPDGSGIQYTKIVNDIPELHFIESVNNSAIQITKNGTLNFDTVPHGYYEGAGNSWDYNHIYDFNYSTPYSTTLTVNKRILFFLIVQNYFSVDGTNLPYTPYYPGYFRLQDSSLNNIIALSWVGTETVTTMPKQTNPTFTPPSHSYFEYLEPGTYYLKALAPSIINGTYTERGAITVMMKAVFAFDDTITDAFTIS